MLLNRIAEALPCLMRWFLDKILVQFCRAEGKGHSNLVAGLISAQHTVFEFEAGHAVTLGVEGTFDVVISEGLKTLGLLLLNCQVMRGHFFIRIVVRRRTTLSNRINTV